MNKLYLIAIARNPSFSANEPHYRYWVSEGEWSVDPLAATKFTSRSGAEKFLDQATGIKDKDVEIHVFERVQSFCYTRLPNRYVEVD